MLHRTAYQILEAIGRLLGLTRVGDRLLLTGNQAVDVAGCLCSSACGFLAFPLSFCLTLPLGLCLALALCLRLSLSFGVSLSLALCLCLALTLSFRLSLPFGFSLALALCLRLSLPFGFSLALTLCLLGETLLLRLALALGGGCLLLLALTRLLFGFLGSPLGFGFGLLTLCFAGLGDGLALSLLLGLLRLTCRRLGFGLLAFGFGGGLLFGLTLRLLLGLALSGARARLLRPLRLIGRRLGADQGRLHHRR